MTGWPHGNRPIYHGWYVVAGAFAVAFFAFGMGFYGPGIYLVALQNRNGWPVADISAAITLYYVLGAAMVFFAGRVFEAYGIRRPLAFGAIAMVCGLVLLTLITRKWQVFAAFAVMSVGWAAMSGAAINFIIAPWFFQRRGLAVSLALTGASAGGTVMAPLLVMLIEQVGLRLAIVPTSIIMLLVLLPVIMLVFRPKRADERDLRDPPQPSQPTPGTSCSNEPKPSLPLARMLGDWRFLSISIPFAIGTLTLVGFLTHQLAYLSPLLGTVAAGWAVSLTTASALVGRLASGLVIDRIDQRLAAGFYFLLQIAGLGLLAWGTSETILYLGCVLFGVALGNLVTLPGLLVQREFARAHFIRMLSLVIAVNQFTYAFGPWLVGLLEHATGSYRTAFTACLSLDLVAAAIVVAPRLVQYRSQGYRPH